MAACDRSGQGNPECTRQACPDCIPEAFRTVLATNEAAALKYAPEIAAGRIPSMRRVRSEMHVGQTRAQQIAAHLSALTTKEIAA